MIEVTAPIIEAQLLETILINRVNLQTILATKASRVIHAAAGRTVVDFAARRAQGTEAADRLAKAGYIAGYAGTSNVGAGVRYGIPTAGTMAHSFVMCFESETEAFRAYAESFPDSSTFLVDTYGTTGGVRAAIAVAGEMREAGHALRAIRIDSGDFAGLSARARAMLDDAGLREVEIFVSGGLDEFEVDSLVRSEAPIDGFGVRTKAGVSADAPWTDCAYKLVEYDGKPILKLSTGKASLPGRKQVYRSPDDEGALRPGHDSPGRRAAARWGRAACRRGHARRPDCRAAPAPVRHTRTPRRRACLSPAATQGPQVTGPVRRTNQRPARRPPAHASPARRISRGKRLPGIPLKGRDPWPVCHTLNEKT